MVDQEGTPVGLMTAESFIENPGEQINTIQTASITLYFSNKAGDGLVKEVQEIHYSSNISLEKLVMEQLLKGPQGKKGRTAIPDGTKLVGGSVHARAQAAQQQRKQQKTEQLPKTLEYNSQYQGQGARAVSGGHVYPAYGILIYHSDGQYQPGNTLMVQGRKIPMPRRETCSPEMARIWEIPALWYKSLISWSK